MAKLVPAADVLAHLNLDGAVAAVGADELPDRLADLYRDPFTLKRRGSFLTRRMSA